jgi:hypothetical protein
LVVARVGLQALDAVAAEQPEVLVAVVPVELPAPGAEVVARAGPQAPVAVVAEQPEVLVVVVLVEVPVPRAGVIAQAGLQALDAVVAEQPEVLVAVVPVELPAPGAVVVAQAEFPVSAVADSVAHSVGHSVVLGAAIAVLGAQAAEWGEPPAPDAWQEPVQGLVRARWALEPAGGELPRGQATAAV